MADSSPLAFVIIGAQKAGTTSLFEYLRHHPEIHMPAQKEIGFFSSDRHYARGWDWYASTALRPAAAGLTCGEASVSYMSGTPDRRGLAAAAAPHPISPGDRPEDIIPRRIREHAPDAKLICVLRDPVARCLSHYRMMVLAGLEARPFEQAIAEALLPDELERARYTVTGANGYVARGEYFRILSGFVRAFSREQLMVVFSDELAERPEDVLVRVFEFIGVDPHFVPDNLHVRYRQAAVTRRLRGLDLYAWQARASHAAAPRALWRALPSPARMRIDAAFQRASFVVEMWNAQRGELDNGMAKLLQETLCSHFRADSEALESALAVDVPWLADWAVTRREPTGSRESLRS